MCVHSAFPRARFGTRLRAPLSPGLLSRIGNARRIYKSPINVKKKNEKRTKEEFFRDNFASNIAAVVRVIKINDGSRIAANLINYIILCYIICSLL